jgi:PKHD-type hydroxylase
VSEIIKPELSIDLPTLGKADAPGGGWHFKQDFPHEWCWFKDTFTPVELDAIIRIGEQIEMDKGRTGGGSSTKVRDSYVSWFFPNDVTGWVFERMAAMVTTMNEQFFRFELDGFLQGFQFTKYTAPGQHYTWHCDRGGGHGVRKLSISVLLSDPDDYEGGDLELKFGEEEQKAERVRGMATIFPSWSLHRVTPVTKGTRYSLVAWVSGPPFK